MIVSALEEKAREAEAPVGREVKEGSLSPNISQIRSDGKGHVRSQKIWG